MTFGVIVGSRAFFNGRPSLGAREDLLAALEKAGAGWHILPGGRDGQRRGGDARGRAQVRQALPRDTGTRSTASWSCCPTSATSSAWWRRCARPTWTCRCWSRPATTSSTRSTSHSRRDAFCGKLSVCNNLYQYGIPFTDTTSHTCDARQPGVRRRPRPVRRVCRTVQRPAPGPHRRHRRPPRRLPDHALQREAAAGLRHHGGHRSTSRRSSARPQRLDDGDADVKAKLRGRSAPTAGSRPPSGARTSSSRPSSGVAIDRWMRENECDATAIQCWTSVQQNYGCATCLSMSMMGEQLMPSACEVDVPAPSRCTPWRSPPATPSALLDWNNNYGQRARTSASARTAATIPKSFLGRHPGDLQPGRARHRRSAARTASARSRARSRRGR